MVHTLTNSNASQTRSFTLNGSNNQIALDSLTSSDVGSYTLDYEAKIELSNGDYVVVKTSQFSFEIIQCRYETDHV